MRSFIVKKSPRTSLIIIQNFNVGALRNEVKMRLTPKEFDPLQNGQTIMLHINLEF